MTSITVVRTHEQWSRLQAPWRRLLDEAENSSVFMTWEWLDAWSRYFTDDRELQVIVCTEGDDIVAIVPLVGTVRKRAKVEVRTSRLLGSGLSDQLGLLVRPGREDAMAAVARCLNDGEIAWDLLEIADLDFADPAARALVSELERAGIGARFVESVQCAYVTVASDWESYYAERFGKKTRASNRRKLRKLAEMGDFRIRWVSEPDDVVGALKAIRAMDERSDYQGEERIRPFDSERGQKFFDDFGVSFANNGWLLLGLMELDGALVSYSIGFRFKGRHLDFFGGFDPGMFKLSVGRLLMVELMRRCYEDGVTEIDYLRGFETWKEEWTSASRPNGILTASNPSAGSRMRVMAQKIPLG
ncbi:MAG: GNAT family N-acetyltransferase [Proteobacteria bacterium]|nr:MAG: GNAT family N-acetyltransferase [Pseudomonadota bacterium]